MTDDRPDKYAHGARAAWQEHVVLLEQACAFFQIADGRAVDYSRLVREMFEAGERSDEHLLALNESFELVDLFEHWGESIDLYPGLRSRIGRVLSKGPVLREGEDADCNTNHPRNYAFSYLMAGKLLRAGVDICCVEGVLRVGARSHTDADVTCAVDDVLVDIQCKRPMSESALEKRSTKAVRQVENCGRAGQLGIVAIDCSSLMRPAYTVLARPTEQIALAQVQNYLAEHVAPRVQRHISTAICGYLLFGRVPTMVEEPSVASHESGTSLVSVVPFTVSALVVVENVQCREPRVASDLFDNLRHML